MTTPTKAALLAATLAMIGGVQASALPFSPWSEKVPPSKSGNNRPNNCAARRAKNKAAQKTRAQQRRKTKKG